MRAINICIIIVLLTTASKAADGLKKVILCSFYPMYVFTQNVAAGVSDVKVENMAKAQTGCLHDYQLTPGDMKKLKSAWALVINGGGMESFIDKAIKQTSTLKIIDAGKGIKFIEMSSSHDEHGSGELNPHVWVSVSGAIAQVKNIRNELIIMDPKNAEKYRLNADNYLRSLEELKRKMHEGLSGISNRNIITFHEAFPYFAREFNLNIVAVVEREPGSEPNARELAETIKTIKNTKAKAVFIEPQYSSKTAQVISRETGVKLYTLDPVVTGSGNPDSYISIMEANLKVLQEALR